MVGSKVKLSTEEDSSREFIVTQILLDDKAKIKDGEDIRDVPLIDLEKIKETEPKIFTFDIPEQKKAEGKEQNEKEFSFEIPNEKEFSFEIPNEKEDVKLINIEQNENNDIDLNEMNQMGGEIDLGFDKTLTSIDLDSLI